MAPVRRSCSRVSNDPVPAHSLPRTCLERSFAGKSLRGNPDLASNVTLATKLPRRLIHVKCIEVAHLEETWQVHRISERHA